MTTRSNISSSHDVSTDAVYRCYVQSTVPKGAGRGDLWLDTSGTPAFKIYDGAAFVSAGGGGSGDVVGPASATDNAIVRYDSTTGKLIQNSGVTISDAGVLTLAGDLNVNNKVIVSGANDDVAVKLGDDIGAGKFRVRNSAGSSRLSINSLGDISLLGTVDGRDVAADGTKLDGIPGGSDTQLQFNNAGTIGGVSKMTFDGTHLLLTTTTRLQLRDAAIYLASLADGEVTLLADVMTNIGVAGDIILGDGDEHNIKPAVDLKENLGTPSLRFNEGHIKKLFAGQSIANITTPTDAELDAEFGTPASLGAGFIATIDDNNANSASTLVWTTNGASGTPAWWYVAGTKAT